MPKYLYALSLFEIALLGSGTADAEITFLPRAGVNYDHNSNIFALPDNDTNGPPGRPAGSPKSDSTISYIGGLNSDIKWDGQTLSLGGDARRVTYQRYNDLDNTSYNFNGNLQWQAGSKLDGNLGYTQGRNMYSFADQQGDTTQLQIQTTRTVNAALQYKVTPQWILKPQYSVTDSNSPQIGFADLGTREQNSGLGLQYAGFGRLTFGVRGDYTRGTYKGVVGDPSYISRAAEFNTNYEASGLSSFNAALGYTKREQGASSSTSALTGALGYRRQITGKTSVYLQYNRSVNTYVAAGSAELDSSIGVGAHWNATRKLSADIGYSWTRSTFQGQLLPGVAVDGRNDKTQNPTLTLSYAALRWLSISSYGTYHKRSSNIDNFTYHDTMWGIDFSVHKPTN